MAEDEAPAKLAAFITAVRHVLPNVGFQVYDRPAKGAADGKSQLDWTDLTGYQKRILLEKLPAE